MFVHLNTIPRRDGESSDSVVSQIEWGVDGQKRNIAHAGYIIVWDTEGGARNNGDRKKRAGRMFRGKNFPCTHKNVKKL